ncbi:hypothetical protein BDB13_2507 [Rhodococcus sp. OK302]|nr:hypothetical protein BDB13_2507 [Rhodococcus sp. OK302]
MGTEWMARTDCGNLDCVSPNALSMLPEVVHATRGEDGPVGPFAWFPQQVCSWAPIILCGIAHL